MGYDFKEETSRIVALDENGKEAGELGFTWEGDSVLVIDHTEVDEAHRDQGLGGELVKQTVEKAKNENLKIMPVCPYAKKQFTENEEYQTYLQN